MISEKVALKRIGFIQILTLLEEANSVQRKPHFDCLKNSQFRYIQGRSDSLGCLLLMYNVERHFDCPVLLTVTIRSGSFGKTWNIACQIPFLNNWVAVTLSAFLWLHLTEIIYRERHRLCVWSAMCLSCLILLSEEPKQVKSSVTFVISIGKSNRQKTPGTKLSFCTWLHLRAELPLSHP